jgi:hypothetical protein
MAMMTRLNGLAALCLAFAFGATAASAQDCNTYKVNTSLLNISQQAGSDNYKDALFDGDTVCVAQQQNVNGVDWAYISSKLDAGNARTLVDGWAPLKYLQQAGPNQAAASPPPAQPPAAAPAQPPAPPAAPVANAKIPGPPIRPEDVLRFDQPIPFGPFPVNGHSLAEITSTFTPLFPPIEDLPDELWKDKKCTTCHQWNKARLCEQGATYVAAPRYALRVQHPFGGTLQVAMMRWVKSGCQ